MQPLLSLRRLHMLHVPLLDIQSLLCLDFFPFHLYGLIHLIFKSPFLFIKQFHLDRMSILKLLQWLMMDRADKVVDLGSLTFLGLPIAESCLVQLVIQKCRFIDGCILFLLLKLVMGGILRWLLLVVLLGGVLACRGWDLRDHLIASIRRVRYLRCRPFEDNLPWWPFGCSTFLEDWIVLICIWWQCLISSLWAIEIVNILITKDAIGAPSTTNQALRTRIIARSTTATVTHDGRLRLSGLLAFHW